MTNERRSRFQYHLERGTVLSRRTVLFGAAGAVLLAACGDDSALLNETASDGSSTTAAESTSESTEATETAAAATETTTAETTATNGGSAAEMAVNFTYTMSAEGKLENPYIAVWLEDTNGDLIDTIAVWFLQGQKGTEWLPDLSAWYSEVTAAGADYSTVSGATRAAGAYSVSWQGRDGSGVPDGDYFVNIESVRERGPTSLIRESITVAGAGSVDLAGDGELSAASVELIA